MPIVPGGGPRRRPGAQQPQWPQWGPAAAGPDVQTTGAAANGGGWPWAGGGPWGWPQLGDEWWPSWATGLSGGKAERLQGWMAQFLPYLQAYQQQQQWGGEFDWRKEMDKWSQAFQGEQFDWQKAADLWGQQMQEQMFGWEQEQGRWGQEFQTEQLDWQKEAEAQRLAAEREAANLQGFGRRWRPSTRWS